VAPHDELPPAFAGFGAPQRLQRSRSSPALQCGAHYAGGGGVFLSDSGHASSSELSLLLPSSSLTGSPPASKLSLSGLSSPAAGARWGLLPAATSLHELALQGKP
jgi:hypothetical protein